MYFKAVVLFFVDSAILWRTLAEGIESSPIARAQGEEYKLVCREDKTVYLSIKLLSHEHDVALGRRYGFLSSRYFWICCGGVSWNSISCGTGWVRYQFTRATFSLVNG